MLPMMLDETTGNTFTVYDPEVERTIRNCEHTFGLNREGGHPNEYYFCCKCHAQICGAPSRSGPICNQTAFHDEGTHFNSFMNYRWKD